MGHGARIMAPFSDPRNPMSDVSPETRRGQLPELHGTRTHENLRAAFARDAQTSRLYTYFARIAEIEGFPDVSRAMRELAESETLYAHGHLDFLRRAGDPLTSMPIGETELNLRSAIAGERDAAQEAIEVMARTAHAEGFPDVASWFESVAIARTAHAHTCESALAHTRQETT